jgi:RND family efflux transporter MFP subunit
MITKYNFIILFIALALFSGCENKKEIPTENQTENIPKVSIYIPSKKGEDSFTTLGQVGFMQSTYEKAPFRSNVKNIYVKNGERIKKGQLLLELSDQEITKKFQQKRIEFQKTQVQTQRSNSSQTQNTESAYKKLQKAELELTNIQKQKEQKEEQAKEQKESEYLDTELNIKSAEIALINSLRNIKTDIIESLDIVDNFLGITETKKYFNDSFQSHIGALNLEAKRTANNLFLDIQKNYADLSEINIDSYDTYYKIAIDVEKLDDIILVVLQSSTTSDNYTTTQLNTDITSVKTILKNIRTKIQDITEKKKQLSKVQKYTDDNTSHLFKKSDIDYQTRLLELDIEEDRAQQSLELAKQEYKALQEQEKLGNITNAISSIRGGNDFENAKTQYEKLFIRAKFDGIITEIPVDIGDQVLQNEALITVHDDSSYIITTSVNQEQKQHIHTGDSIRIGTKSIDTIFSLSDTLHPETRKYTVKIKHKNPYLHGGQIIPLHFTYTQKKEHIQIPLEALHVHPEGNFVWLVIEEDNKFFTQKQKVQTGHLIGNNIIVSEGLEGGEKIVHTGGRMFEKNTAIIIKNTHE